MEHGIDLVRDLAVVLMAAAVTAVLFQRLRQSIVLGYLLAGVVIGPYFGLRLVVDFDRIHTLAELGVILLMFSLGLKFQLHKLAALAPTAGVITVIEVGITMTLGFLAGQLLGWTTLESVFAGSIVAISSTMIITKLFEERDIRGRLADRVFSILVFEDLIVIFLITVLTAVATGINVSPEMLGLTLAKLVAFLGFFLIVGLLTLPRVLRRVGRQRRSETLLIVSIGLCFGSAFLARAVGFSVALGAFMAGSLIAESGVSHQVDRVIIPVRDMFAAIFFVSTGMLVDPAQVLAAWPAVLLLVIVVIVGKVLGVTVGTFIAGYGVQPAVRTGMSMAQIGEFSYIIAGIGVFYEVVGNQIYPAAVAVSVITASTSPLLLSQRDRVAHWVDHILPQRIKTFATVYASWVESLRKDTPPPGTAGGKIARLTRVMLLESVLLVTFTIGSAVGMAPIRQWVTDTTGLPRIPVALVALSLVAFVIFPIVLSIVGSARQLGSALALAAFPVGKGGLDYGHEPRRALRLTAEIAIVLLVGTPIVVVTLPFIPAYIGPPALVILVALFGVAFWRSVGSLEGHYLATGGLITEALLRQRTGNEPSAIERVRDLMPGIGALTPITLADDSPALGKTLAEIDLRGLTGATIVALCRGEERIQFPSGGQQLHAGDLIALTGSESAIAAATKLLEH